MRTRHVEGVEHVARFAIDLEVANNTDLALANARTLDPKKVRRKKVRGIVDSGAARLVLPEALVKELGLPEGDKVRVRHADGRTALRKTAENVRVEIQGRSGIFRAIVEPKRTDVLVGAIVLEDFDFLVDCSEERIVPRDPRFVVSEIG